MLNRPILAKYPVCQSATAGADVRWRIDNLVSAQNSSSANSILDSMSRHRRSGSCGSISSGKSSGIELGRTFKCKKDIKGIKGNEETRSNVVREDTDPNIPQQGTQTARTQSSP